jgi:GSH-dependent disulfide-bond oxidoreductase
LAAQVATVGPLLGQNTHFRLLPAEITSYATQRYAEQARRVYQVLNNRLREAPWLAGDHYSIADIATYPWALYVPKHGLDWADYPAIKEWCDQIAARPAVKRAASAINIVLPKDVAAMKEATPEQIDQFMWREQSGPPIDFSLVR